MRINTLTKSNFSFIISHALSLVDTDSCNWEKSCTTWNFYSRKPLNIILNIGSWYQSNRRLCGSQRQFGRNGEENMFSPCPESNHHSSCCMWIQSAAWSLYQLGSAVCINWKNWGRPCKSWAIISIDQKESQKVNFQVIKARVLQTWQFSLQFPEQFETHEVLTVATILTAINWDVALCNLVEVHGPWRKIFWYLEDGVSVFPRNASKHLPDYKESHVALKKVLINILWLPYIQKAGFSQLLLTAKVCLAG
jgi:hypothetical protein